MSAIEFGDYLSEELKREIAETAFREICEEKFRSDAERIFSNTAYKAVWTVVDDMFDGKAADAVAAKVPKIIETLSEHSVFHNGRYGEPKSEGRKEIDRAVAHHRDSIGERVAYLVGSITKDDVLEAIVDYNEGDFNFKLSFK